MSRLVRRAPIAVTAAIAALVLAACGSSSTNEATSASAAPASGAASAAPVATTPVSMGTQPWLGYGAWYIAQDQGYFGEQGIEVNIVNFNADADVNTALAAGKVDVANLASHTALAMAAAGLPITIVMLEDVSTTADAIISDGSVKTVADLKGKQVAYEEGTTSDILLNYALQKNGMTIEDIVKVPMPASDAGTALAAGKVPVAVTYEPYITEALGKNADASLLFTAAENPGLISDVLVVRNEFLAANPAAVQGLVNAWMKSVAFYDADKAAGQQIISAALDSSAADLKTAFDGVQYLGLAGNQDLLPGAYLTTTIKDVLAAAKVAGIVTEEIDPASIVDTQFVAAATS